MARGTGVRNGLLVPVVAIILIGILGAIVTGVVGRRPSGVDGTGGATAAQHGPGHRHWHRDRVLAAALIRGALGGGLGARWHTRLENEASLAHRDRTQ